MHNATKSLRTSAFGRAHAPIAAERHAGSLCTTTGSCVGRAGGAAREATTGRARAPSDTRCGQTANPTTAESRRIRGKCGVTHVVPSARHCVGSLQSDVFRKDKQLLAAIQPTPSDPSFPPPKSNSIMQALKCVVVGDGTSSFFFCSVIAGSMSVGTLSRSSVRSFPPDVTQAPSARLLS